MHVLLLLGLPLGLGGCCSEPLPPLISACPDVMLYSIEQQKEAAAELRALPPGSMLAEMLRDYDQLRGQLRAC